MKKEKPRRGGWSGGPVPEPDNKYVWWCLALGFTAVAISLYVISNS